MSHGAIFLATCNTILLLRDVNLANTHLHYILLMYSSHITKQSSLKHLLNVKLRCKSHEILHRQKLMKMRIFAMKIYYIFSQNDLNISHTKNHWG